VALRLAASYRLWLRTSGVTVAAPVKGIPRNRTCHLGFIPEASSSDFSAALIRVTRTDGPATRRFALIHPARKDPPPTLARYDAYATEHGWHRRQWFPVFTEDHDVPLRLTAGIALYEWTPDGGFPAVEQLTFDTPLLSIPRGIDRREALTRLLLRTCTAPGQGVAEFFSTDHRFVDQCLSAGRYPILVTADEDAFVRIHQSLNTTPLLL